MTAGLIALFVLIVFVFIVAASGVVARASAVEKPAQLTVQYRRDRSDHNTRRQKQQTRASPPHPISGQGIRSTWPRAAAGRTPRNERDRRSTRPVRKARKLPVGGVAHLDGTTGVEIERSEDPAIARTDDHELVVQVWEAGDSPKNAFEILAGRPAACSEEVCILLEAVLRMQAVVRCRAQNVLARLANDLEVMKRNAEVPRQSRRRKILKRSRF